MMVDIHSLHLPLLCQLSKSTPNILWSFGSSLHHRTLPISASNPAVVIAKLTLMSLFGRKSSPAPVAGTGGRARMRQETG